ncbi:ABC transporter permease [Aurantimonas sp. A2-1-M11]|uniref:ABC transporter permease n=1 Tax=Aurantimonas sp. A2-1-M11 TaxID=3113712 RepID=UPI002F941ABD
MASTAMSNALADIRKGIQMHRVWIALAYEEVGNQHRRTALGPIWLFLNYLAFAGTFIFVFQRGDSGVANYSAYVATGLLVWFLIMETFSQSVAVFVRSEGFIKGTRLPLSVYVMQQSVQLLIRAGYASGGCLVILAFGGVSISAEAAWAFVGALVIVGTIPAVVILVGFLGAFFPDSQYIISNAMRIGMFLTPVFWINADSGIRQTLYFINPFTYYIEIFRYPIVYQEVHWGALYFCVTLGLILWTAALFVLGSCSRKLVFVI